MAQSPSSDAERTINLFLEELEIERGKGRYVFYKSPGLRSFLTLSGPSIRGLLPLNRLEGISANDGVYAVSGTTVTVFDTSGNIVNTRSPIPDDGALVSMAASLTALGISSAGSVYYIDGTPPYLHGPINWWGPGITIGDIGVINEFFVFLDIGSYVGGFYYSEPGDINSGTSLNFITAEANANKYIRLLVDRQEIWLFGSQVTQVFYDNSSNDPNNPFVPNLSAVIPHGVVAKQSAISVNGRMCWLGKSKNEVGVAFTTDGGYVARRVSNHAVEYAWSTYPRIDDAVSWTFTMKGHPLWRLWFPSADVTWEYDFAVNDWREILSWDANTAQYHAHFGQVACAAGSSILVGARNSGAIYKTSLDYADDAGARIRWLRRSPILSNENKRVAYPWFELDMQAGVGLPVSPSVTQAQVNAMELLDLGLNSDTSIVTFNRTLFRWVKADWPAGTTFRIDIVGNNNNATTDYTVSVIDSSGTVVASFVLAHGISNTTLYENLAAWAPTLADDKYRIKLPATGSTGDIVIDSFRIVAIVNGSFVPIEIPLSSGEGHTALDQTAGGGDLYRSTSTTFNAGQALYRWTYHAAEWATVTGFRFSACFGSAVVNLGSGLWGEVCLWDRTANAAVTGTTVNNSTSPDTVPVYKDAALAASALIDGHTYEPRIRSSGVTYNTYFHKARLQIQLNPWTTGLLPFRVGKGGTAGLARMKMPALTAFTPGSVGARFVEGYGITDPGQNNQGAYIADGGLYDADQTFANVTASFLGQYSDVLPSVPFRSGDIAGSLIALDRYSMQRTNLINFQSQMLLYFTLVAVTIEVPETDPKVMIRWSNDWAKTWSNEYQRSFGKQGEYTKRIIKRGTGIARQRVFEVSGSAAVPTVINAAYLRDPGVRKT